MNIGRNIKRLREFRELSQKDLVESLNATLGTKYGSNNISNYETGVSTPPLDVLIQIAEILETTLDNLVGNADFPSDSSSISSEANQSVNNPDTLNPYKIIAGCLPDLPKRSQMALSKVAERIYELERRELDYEKDKNKALQKIVRLDALAKSFLKSLKKSGIKVDEDILPDDPLEDLN